MKSGLLAVVLLAACSSGAAETHSSVTPATWFAAHERAEAVVACLKSRGIHAEVENGFGVSFTDPTGVAYDECQAEVDERMPPPPLMSDRENYEAWIQAAECIRDLGFDVAKTPSFEVWVEDRGENWNPYDSLLGETFWEVHAICPQPGLGLRPSTTVTRTGDS